MGRRNPGPKEQAPVRKSHAKQRKELCALREAVTTMCQVLSKTRDTIDPGRVLTKQTPDDDVEAYLEVF